MSGHQAQWVTASPLWAARAENPALLQRPVLLRFASDSFMEDLSALLQTEANRLAELVATPQTYRELLPGEKLSDVQLPTRLRLYQPAHSHFYLVAANVVCRTAGMPDRAVDASADEKTGFVMRRVRADGGELAWVSDPVQGKTWQPVSRDAGGDFRCLGKYEEVLPLFPVHYTPKEGRRRRIMAGLIPTSSRESFQAAPELSIVASGNDALSTQEQDPRLAGLDNRVLDRVRELQAPTAALPDSLTDAQRTAITNATAKTEQEASLFILLDLAGLLEANLPALWPALADPKVAVPSGAPGRVYTRLASAAAAGATTWLDALRAAWALRANLDSPNLGFSYNLKNSTLDLAGFRADVATAFDGAPPAAPPTPAAAAASAPPKFFSIPEAEYVVRCVYQRPRCGELQPDVVSAATDRFTLASFFDPDAPARPIRISLPVDTSIAGLRKFHKNVSFLISNKLRSQMESTADLKAAMDGNLSSGESFQWGQICSFSIPIITICAMIVLMIFISLLNFVFWWKPFLKICFPIPMKAK